MHENPSGIRIPTGLDIDVIGGGDIPKGPTDSRGLGLVALNMSLPKGTGVGIDPVAAANRRRNMNRPHPPSRGRRGGRRQ